MKIAPLIYSRTLHCDFNSNFAVRPKNLNVAWARDIVRASTKEIGILNDIRRVVASKDGIGIAGVACIFKFFVEKYLPDKVQDAEKCFRDERGREVKIFLGYAFEMSGQKELPSITDADILQMFMDTLAPEWDRKFVETVYSNYSEYDIKIFLGDKKPVDNINGVEIYRDDVFNQFLASAQVKELSYCSNVNQFDIWQEGQFSAISTSDNSVISGLKSAQKKKPSPQSQPTQNTQPTQSTQPVQTTNQQFSRQQTATTNRRPQDTTSSSPILIIALIVIIAAIIGSVIIFNSNDVEERQQESSLMSQTIML